MRLVPAPVALRSLAWLVPCFSEHSHSYSLHRTYRRLYAARFSLPCSARNASLFALEGNFALHCTLVHANHRRSQLADGQVGRKDAAGKDDVSLRVVLDKGEAGEDISIVLDGILHDILVAVKGVGALVL